MKNLSITTGLVPDQLVKQLKHIDCILTFLNDHPGLSEAYYAASVDHYNPQPTLYLTDPALVGYILGKTDWTRIASYGNYNWTRDFPDYKLTVIINNAEIIDIDPVVQPRQFPLLLSDSPVQPADSAQTVGDSQF